MTTPWSATTVSGSVPDALWAAYEQYEEALRENDLQVLSDLFAPGPDTLRADGTGVLVGHDAVTAFRASRGGTGARLIRDCHVRMIDGHNAIVVATNAPERGGFGVVSQWWSLREVGGDQPRWVIAAAQVAAQPPALDRSVWRVVGSPLVRGSDGGAGPLAGESVAVKDLFDVAGHAVGAGIPGFLAGSAPASCHAPAVAALLAAGADVLGIAQTDEFAYSIAGRNPHYGTPPNIAVPGALPGGSSSGPATAVAAGHVSIGLGTDTAGSIRVPASYQGLWGLRSTHGAVDTAGLLPLAPRFDTVGWLARSATVLRHAAATSLDSRSQVGVPAQLVVSPAVLELASAPVRQAFGRAVDGLVSEDVLLPPEEVDLPDLDRALLAFRTVQAAEAWGSHGAWVRAHPGVLAPDVAERFRFAESVTTDQHATAAAEVELLRAELDTRLAGRVLLLPTTPTPAPQADADPVEIDAVRQSTLLLTCIAGIGGYPALSAPLLQVDRSPVGLCFLGPRSADLALVDLGRTCAREASQHT